MILSGHMTMTVCRYGYEKGFEMMKTAGFDAMDHSLEGMTSATDVFQVEGWREHAENIRKMADAAGILINQTHAPFSFGKKYGDEAAFREFVVPTIKRSLEISAILGAKTVVVHPMQHLTYADNAETLFELNMAYYRELIPYAKEYGVKIAVENMWQKDPRRGCIVHSVCSQPEEFIRYIDTLDSEQIVACLDTGHVGLIARKEEAHDLVRALGHDRLQALHVHDNDYQADHHRLPYFGKINWVEFTKALGEIDYQGDMTYETGGRAFFNAVDDEFMPTAMEYAVKVGRHLIEMTDRNRPQK